MKSKINANRALVAKKAKLNKLFTLLTILTLGITNVWADETYKLFYGATKDVNGTTLNSEDFFTTLTSTEGSHEVAGTTYAVKLGYFGGGVEPNVYNKNTNRFIRYDVKTTSVEIEVVAIAKNKNRTVKIGYVKEPGSSTTASEFSSNALGSLTLSTANTGAKSDKISFTTAVNASLIVSASSSATDIQIIQVTVTEKGTPLPKPGDDGYTFRFQQGTSTSAGAGGRHGGGKAVEIPYEGGKFVCCLNSEHTAGTGLPAKLTTKGTHYIKFTTAAYSQVNVSVGGTNAYYISDSKNPSSGTTYTADASVEIEAGTWYIVPNGSDVTIKKISFESATPATKHHVTYDLNGATGSTPTQADVAEGAKFTLHNGTTGITAPENKTFVGWNDGTTTYTGGAEYTMGGDDVTLTAQWATSYDISYNKGTYGIGEIAGGKKAEGVAYTLSSDRFTRAGYVQVGWATEDGGTKAYNLGGSYTTDAAQEFFPVWAETSTYVASFACGATAPSDWTFSNAGFDADNKATADYVCTFTANSLNSPNDNGMSADAVAFAKNTSAIATFDLGAATTVTALNVTLYGGSSSAFNETIEYLGADGSTVKKEYVNSLGAGNWAANNISKTDVVDDVRYIRIHGANKWVVMSAFSVTYVDIAPKYTISFAKGHEDATGSMANIQYHEGAVVPVPANEFEYTSHVFDSWTYSVPVTSVDATHFVMPGSDLTLTAVWVAASDFNVRFFPGYGANEQIGTTQSISTGNFATPEADPTREGYRFLGWSTDGTEANIEDVTAYGITAATDFTAVWVQQFEVTFNLQGYGAAIAAQKVDNGGKVSMPSDPVAADQEFGGWYKESTCDNIWDFNVDVVSTTTEIFAKWTAFTGCTMLHPALSGSALSVNDDVDLQAASNGGSIKVVGMKNATSIQYNSNGLLLGGGGADVIGVTLSSELAVGTQISVKLMAAGTGSRGLDLLTSTGATVGGGTKLGWDDATNGAVATFSYTVVAGDGLEGTNEFRLKRNNSVYLKYVKVESCGSAIIYHDLTSAVDPSGMGTVTLGASSVREGYTTTAEYSAIDAAYEFDEWQISGTGATLSDAHANPVTITMGTADAVVTLKLKVATVKHDVTFNTHGGSAVAKQEVEDGANPAAPADPTKEDYLFQGWAEVEDGAIVDVTSFTITADKEFHAVWAAETGVIKLIVDGATPGEKVINHTNFITGATMAGSPVEIESVNYNYAQLGGTAGTPYNQNQLAKFVAYNATTTQTKVMVDVYNTSTSARQVVIKGIVEGATEATDIATIDLDNGANKHVKSAYYSFDNTKNRTIYISVPSSVNTVDFLQVKIVETGTPLPMFGEAGYSINLNKGRLYGPSATDLPFEGMTYNLGSNYNALYSGSAVFKKSTSYQVDVPAAVTMTVTTANASKYYVSEAADGTDNETSFEGASDFSLTAGTWYINVAGSNLNVTNIAFTAPKCAEPVIDAQPASKLDFAAGDMTASVTAHATDGGTLSYQWYNASDDSEVTGADAATLTTTIEGTYYVIVTNTLADHADNFIKSDEATLKYRKADDATLSALTVSEGTLTPAFDPEVLEYNVTLSEGTVDVPTLTATAAMAAYGATADVTDAAAFVNYEATSTVLVTAEDHSTQQTYTVHFYVEHTILALVDVTGDMTWDFSKDGLADQATVGTEVIMANVAGVVNDANFKSDNIKVTANKQAGTKLQASMIMFHSTVDGLIKVVFSNTGDKSSERYLVVNGKKTDSGTKTKTNITYYGFVPAGDVVLTVIEGDGNMLNFASVQFTAKATADLARDASTGDDWMAPGELGTVCIPNGAVATGGDLYTLEEKNSDGKIVFATVPNNKMTPGVPYLFQATSNAMKFYYTDEATVAAPDNSGAMKSTFEDGVVLSGDDLNDVYYFNGHALWNAAALIELPVVKYRAYVKMDEVREIGGGASGAPGRRYIFMDVHGQNATTGFGEVQGDDVQCTKVLINGQLFILRGEKMYDTTGRLVK